MRGMRGRNCGVNTSAAELGASNPALYRSELVDGFCHGDDFVDCGSRRSKRDLCKRNLTRDGAVSVVQQGIWTKNWKCLHRSVRVINSELMEIEADQKHVPQLLEDLGFIQSNIA